MLYVMLYVMIYVIWWYEMNNKKAHFYLFNQVTDLQIELISKLHDIQIKAEEICISCDDEKIIEMKIKKDNDS